jgi:hypothetical protein
MSRDRLYLAANNERRQKKKTNGKGDTREHVTVTIGEEAGKDVECTE